MSEWFWVGAGATALLLALAHWFPYPARLKRLVAYFIGVSCLLIGFTIWLGQEGEWDIVAGLVAISVIGGLVTAGCYGIDWLALVIKKSWKAERDIKRRFPNELD